MPVLAALIASVLVWLREDFGAHLGPPVLALSVEPGGKRRVVEVTPDDPRHP